LFCLLNLDVAASISLVSTISALPINLTGALFAASSSSLSWLRSFICLANSTLVSAIAPSKPLVIAAC